MNSLRRQLSRAATFALLAANGLADIVILKTGEKVEGRILKDTKEQVVVEVKVTASITDERILARADVERIEKISPEIEAYKTIATIQVGANSFAANQYDPLIGALQGFLDRFPGSPRFNDVRTAMRELSAEKERVLKGEMKLRGQWLGRAEVEKEKTQLDGARAFEYMKSQSAGGDGIGALNTFAAIEKTYAGAVSFPESVELARQIVASLKPAVERAVPIQKAMKAEKEKGFVEASPVDRTEMMAAYKNELAQADAAVVAAEAVGQWPPFIPASEKSITALLARVGREAPRLIALPTDKMRKSIDLANAAKEKIKRGEMDAAAPLLKEASTLWPTNELAVRLTKEVTEAQKAAKEAPKPAAPEPTPSSPPKPAAPKPSVEYAPARPAPVALHPEPPPPFYKTLTGQIGIIVGVAAILTGANVYQKLKARSSAAADY